MVVSDIINAIVAIATVSAVIIAFRAILDNRKQARDDWQHTQQLAQEERQHQERPVLVPTGDVLNFTDLPNRVAPAKPLKIQNIGKGPAFNVHGALYFYNNIWYSSFNNGPVGAGSTYEIIFEHGVDTIGLAISTKIDGKYDLYNKEDPHYRPGRLTLTYRDLYDVTHVSVFDYLAPVPNQYRWVQLSIKSGITKDLEDLDNERVPSSRRMKPNH